ncbi:carbohydrate ABC transporter permease [Clostridium lacusfryxellense]|uniref:carbohydrate ABC transporter permease n=1 Tax=Clostridium lacusfryxellense TaxID=205328 RepID=UPI001C0DCF57|nr:carbohydrate ABC transporter permease [Clostridium lacusfryxellense]MBU3113699.1 carbohydrate ABC transporter permease [Clostridium lacusfryxellense]
MKKKESLLSRFLQGIKIICLALISGVFIFPFYIAIVYAFKSRVETSKSPIAFPSSLYLENFKEAIKLPNYLHTFMNSIIVVIFVVLLVVITCSMAAYIIVRKNNKFYNAFYYIFQLSILLPFPAIMFPLYVLLKDLGLINTLTGLIISQTGILIGFYTFLYAGFIKTVPIELEEAARIDGCSRFRTFFQIVFPLLKPITMTIVILSFLASWNDFIVAMVVAQKPIVRTLPLLQFYFFGEYSSEINLAFAAVIISMAPVMILYFALQKYIIGGVTAGAVKG